MLFPRSEPGASSGAVLFSGSIALYDAHERTTLCVVASELNSTVPARSGRLSTQRLVTNARAARCVQRCVCVLLLIDAHPRLHLPAHRHCTVPRDHCSLCGPRVAQSALSAHLPSPHSTHSISATTP